MLCYGWKIRNVLVFRIDLVKYKDTEKETSRHGAKVED